MKNSSKILNQLITEINCSINEKITGINFLELFKFELIDKLKNLDQKIVDEVKLILSNQENFEKELIIDNRSIIYKVEYFAKSESVIKQITKNDYLSIILDGLKSISVFDKMTANKSIQSYLSKNMGIVLSKETLISSKIAKNSIMLSISNY